MPDEATTRDVAKKLERWAASLPDDERGRVTDWMLLGTGRQDFTPGQRWWFEPTREADRPSSREGH